MNSEIAERSQAKARPVSEPVKSARAGRILRASVNLVLLAGLVVLGYFAFVPKEPVQQAVPAIVTTPPPKTVRKARNLDGLLKIPPAQLADIDIAEMNLLCAADLPGSEKLNINHSLAVLDDWAKRVAVETDRNLQDPTFSRQVDLLPRSEAYRRAEMLLQALRSSLGVKYDPAAKGGLSFKDSRAAFIHGMIPAAGPSPENPPGGTFLSMPVMYVAVGRRLGYPLKLVTTKGHVFVRWDGEGHSKPQWRERFNIDIAGDFSSYPDGYYKSGLFKVTDKEISANRYLISLTPAEELAEFLAYRGHCGSDNGQTAFAARCYENAYGYDPSRPCYRTWFVSAAVRSGYNTDTPVLARLVARRKAVEKQRKEMLARLRRPGGRGDPTVGIDAPRPGSQIPGMPGLPGMPQPTAPRTTRQPPWRPRPSPRPGDPRR